MMEGEHPMASADASAETPIVDWDRALRRVGGSEDVLQEIVQLFCEQECPELMQRIRDAFETADAAMLERAAHTLKSSADLFGAKRAFDSARSLEEMARKSDFHGAADSWRRLEQALPSLQAALVGSET